MMKNIVSIIAMAFLFAISQISCNNDDDGNFQNSVCTDVFIVIEVTVVDQNQNPVALDSFETINLQTGEDITVSLESEELEEAQQTGIYPITSDGVFGVNEEHQIQFRGFQNNQEVLSSNYTVATDCCHIGLVSGDLMLTVQ